MALLYSGNKPKKKTANFTAHILDLDYQGLGVAKINGKTWFIENALPQESVEVRVLEEKRQYGQGVAQSILRPSPHRHAFILNNAGGAKINTFPLNYNVLPSKPHWFNAYPVYSRNPFISCRYCKVSLGITAVGCV